MLPTICKIFRPESAKNPAAGKKSILAFPTYSLNRDRSFETTHIIAKICSNLFPAFLRKSGYLWVMRPNFLASFWQHWFT